MTGEPSEGSHQRSERTLGEDSISRYRLLLQRMSESDADSLSELLVRSGLHILDRDIPYILVALRNRTRDRVRRERRGEELAEALAQPGPIDAVDPAAIVAGRDELQGVLAAMELLEERDRCLLWWHAAGLTDEEIRHRWVAAGFQPSAPSTAMLRQRRARARDHLRRQAGEASR